MSRLKYHWVYADSRDAGETHKQALVKVEKALKADGYSAKDAKQMASKEVQAYQKESVRDVLYGD